MIHSLENRRAFSEVLDKPVVSEKEITTNGNVLVFTNDCPPLIANAIKDRVAKEGTAWLLPHLRNDSERQSRRLVYMARPESHLPVVVFKEKAEKHGKPGTVQGKMVPYFTKSVVHEMRTSFIVRNIVGELAANNKLPATFSNEYGQQRNIKYHVQLPYGAIIDTKNRDSHGHLRSYGMFEWVRGASVRDEINIMGGWEFLSERVQQFFLRLEREVAYPLAVELLKRGIEAHDLGPTQMLYREEGDTLFLTLIDTEEFGLPHLGVDWKEEDFIEGVAPASLLAHMIFNI